MKCEAVLFDFIGTTVKEREPETIMRCFEKAFFDHNIPFIPELIRANRGKDKMEMIGLALDKNKLPRMLARDIYQSFVSNVEHSVDNFVADEGAEKTFSYLKKSGISIGLGSGLSRDLFEKILVHLGWPTTTFDYVGISEEVGRSRPEPDMIFDMMTSLGLSNKRTFLKVGDTVADIQEGRNAGVWTAVVLAGTQTREELEKAKPDFVIESIADLEKILNW